MIKKKKELIIMIPYFLPDESYGGPIVSINSLIKEIGKKIKVSLYTTSLRFTDQNILNTKSHDLIYSKENNTVIIRKDSHFKNFIFTFLKLLELKNKIIYINSFFYLPQSLPFFLLSKYLDNRGNILYVSPRAELLESRKKMSKYLIKKIFIIVFQFLAARNIKFISTSTNEKESNKATFPNNKHTTLPNLPKFNKFFKPMKTKSSKLKLVFFSRIHPEKGLHIFLEALEKHTETLPLEFNIIGSYSGQKYYEYIKKLINLLKNKGYIINDLGHVKITQTQLRKYDVMVLPTVGENFSHTIVEAAQCGLFNLISNNTPWFKNTIAAKKNFTCIPIKNDILYIESIKNLIKLNPLKFNEYVIEQQLEVAKEIKNSNQTVRNFLI